MQLHKPGHFDFPMSGTFYASVLPFLQEWVLSLLPQYKKDKETVILLLFKERWLKQNKSKIPNFILKNKTEKPL